MKRLALLSALLLSTSAFGADMQVKAPVKSAQVYCTVTYCTGFFIGGSILNAGGTFNIVGTGINGLVQTDFAMGGQIGYEFFKNNWYFAPLAHIESDVATSTSAGANFGSRLTYGVCGRLGYSLAGLLGATTSGATTPTLPQQLLNSLMTPYVDVCEERRHNQNAVASGVGVEALIAADSVGRSAWTLNLDYLNYQYNQGGSSGGALGGLPTSQNSENLIKASLNYHFGL